MNIVSTKLSIISMKFCFGTKVCTRFVHFMSGTYFFPDLFSELILFLIFPNILFISGLYWV